MSEYENSPRGCTRGLVSCELFHMEHFASITKAKKYLRQIDTKRLLFALNYSNIINEGREYKRKENSTKCGDNKKEKRLR